MKQWPLSLAFALLAMASGAYAQTLYKSTMPDGRIVYGEKPEPGAKRVDTVEPPPGKIGTTVPAPEDKKRVDERVRARAAASEAERRELETAYQQLKEAEAALEAGKEPLPGERIGTATKGSRLTDAYFDRQKRLEDAVEAARARVKKAEQAGR